MGVSESERKEGGDQGGVWCCHQPQEVTAPGGRWRRSGHDRDGANAKQGERGKQEKQKKIERGRKAYRRGGIGRRYGRRERSSGSDGEGEVRGVEAGSSKGRGVRVGECETPVPCWVETRGERPCVNAWMTVRTLVSKGYEHS